MNRLKYFLILFWAPFPAFAARFFLQVIVGENEGCAAKKELKQTRLIRGAICLSLQNSPILKI